MTSNFFVAFCNFNITSVRASLKYRWRREHRANRYVASSRSSSHSLHSKARFSLSKLTVFVTYRSMSDAKILHPYCKFSRSSSLLRSRSAFSAWKMWQYATYASLTKTVSFSCLRVRLSMLRRNVRCMCSRDDPVSTFRTCRHSWEIMKLMIFLSASELK